MRAVILLELDHRLDRKILLQLPHVRSRGAAERVDRLVVVADGKHGVIAAGKQAQPLILQAIGVLKFVNQNMTKALAIMLAQDLVARQKFETAQQQFGEIDHALALALFVVNRIQLLLAARVAVVRVCIGSAPALILVIIDVPSHLPRWKALFIDVGRFAQPLDECKLVLAVENLESLRQTGIAVMRAQKTVAQSVKGAHPHAARINRQHRTDAREHFLGSFVGKCHRQQPGRTHLPRLDKPRDARGQHARFAAARAGEDQCRLVRQRDRLVLPLIEAAEKFRIHVMRLVVR